MGLFVHSQLSLAWATERVTCEHEPAFKNFFFYVNDHLLVMQYVLFFLHHTLLIS